MFRTKLTLWDAVATGIVLLCACLLLFQPWQARTRGETLLVTTPEASFSYSLRQDQSISLEAQGVSLCIVIENGAAYVKESTCPDGVCLAGGRISQSGETLLCAPAGVRITVKGGDGDVDFVAG